MYQQVLTFWFEEIEESKWWTKDDEFDLLVFGRFSTLHEQAGRCELFGWRENAKGRLAEIILLDQFSRNMFRDSPLAFANDSLALALSQEAIAVKADADLSPVEKSFLYMPFMHSESLAIHGIAAELYKENGIESNYLFEIQHKNIIEQFGRYPHRNEILGRKPTQDEEKFLTQPGSNF